MADGEKLVLSKAVGASGRNGKSCSDATEYDSKSAISLRNLKGQKKKYAKGTWNLVA